MFLRQSLNHTELIGSTMAYKSASHISYTNKVNCRPTQEGSLDNNKK